MTTPHHPTDLGEPGTPSVVAPPRAVRLAFRLFIGVAVLRVLEVGFAAVVGATGSAASPPDLDGLTSEQGGWMTWIVLVVAFAIVAGAIALLVAFTFRMRAGHNWARILLTIIGGISAARAVVPSVFPPEFRTVVSAGDAVLLVLSIAEVVTTVAAIVLMFRPDANRYFRRR